MQFTGDVEIECFCDGERNLVPICDLEEGQFNDVMIFYKKNIYSFYTIQTSYQKTKRIIYKHTNDDIEHTIHTINNQLWKVNSNLVKTEDLKPGDILESESDEIHVVKIKSGIHDCLYTVDNVLYDYIILKHGIKAYKPMLNFYLYSYMFNMLTYFVENKTCSKINPYYMNNCRKIYTHSNVIIVPNDLYILLYENSAYVYKKIQNLSKHGGELIHKFMIKDNVYSIDQIVKVEEGYTTPFLIESNNFYYGKDNAYYNLSSNNEK